VSAFWHGFYPGYYFAFALASFEIDIFRQLRGRFRPLFTTEADVGIYPQKHIYDFVGWVLATVSFNFGLAFFVGLSLERAWIICQNFYFLPFIAPIVVYGILAGLPRSKPKPKVSKD
jgi:lysophospholipid acyltransferase